MMKPLDFYSDTLVRLNNEGLLRTVKNIVQDGKYIFLENKKLLNLSSNDYLGISADYSICDNFLSQYKGKIQNPSARLLSGTNKVFLELEDFISSVLKKEKTLLFNSGYHANTGIYSSLLDFNDVVFIDKLNHASIIDGIKLSGAKMIPYNHLDYFDLEQKLIKYRHKFKKSVISSESLFSMDGDFADLNKLSSLKEKFNSLLIIDEAHSFGVYGNGTTYSIETGANDNIDLTMATFGKAIGSYGAFVTGKSVLIDYLKNSARSFIFSTALPEISVSFSKYVLENYILEGKLQQRLFDVTDYAVSKIQTSSKSYIIPVIYGESNKAVQKSEFLIKNGFYVLPIRYPTVKKDQARIRISLNPLITKNEIDKLRDII